MVQVLPKVESFGSQFGKALGVGAGEGVAKGIQLKRENEAIKKNYGLDLSGITDPNTRSQLISDQLKYGRSLKQAQATEDISYSPEGRQKLPAFMGEETRGNVEQDVPAAPKRRRDNKEFLQETRARKEELPNFAGSENEIKPFAHAPQTETQGVKYQILNPQELMQEAERISHEQNQRGIPTNLEEGLRIANLVNDQKKQYNSEVDSDIEQQVKSQQGYGKLAEDKLLKLFPEATDEHRALAQRWGEEASQGNKSEAAINKELSEKAKHLKNTLANVRKSLPAPRVFEKMKRHILGTDREWDKTKSDIRLKLKPLLDEGLYDTARDELSKLGYQPEERESIITDLGEGSRRILADFPNIKKTEEGIKTTIGGIPLGEPYYSPQDKEKISQGITSTLTAEPSANLILLRKAFEEKGVDWQEFKDNINDLIFDGQIKLNDDQFKHLDLLDSPPLDKLEKLLHGLNLIGR